MSIRLHIFGASGAGTTTLARAIASDWSVPCHDCDDYYWLPTDPPFQKKREIHERLALMEQLFLARSEWVLSGSLFSWGAPLVQFFDAVVFVSLDNETRLERLRSREVVRLGEAAIAPGGKRYQSFSDFMDWNARYEDPDFTGRSRASHENWIAGLPCPVIRVDSANPVDVLVQQVNAALRSHESLGPD